MSLSHTIIDKTMFGLLIYRLKRNVFATLISLVFAFGLVWFLCLVIGKVYPDFRAYYKNSIPFSWFKDRGRKYNFYSGENGGVYSAVTGAITNDTIEARMSANERIGLFDGNDTLINSGTGGGFDNFMKVSTERNAFGLVQEAIINLQDQQVRRNVTVETPLFMERLHIFYRKDMFSGIPVDEMQLSANTDARILRCFTNCVKNIEVGVVGSCTRVIASDVMDLLERQITKNLGKDSLTCRGYKLIGDSLSTVRRRMLKYGDPDLRQDSVVDVMFLVEADPFDSTTNLLNCGKYGMMSVHPSFMGLLNKEFNLNLHVADFHRKYEGTQDINTVGTYTFLIASKEIQSDDIASILKKIYDSSKAIHKSLVRLPDSCYDVTANKCPYVLPLAELGFYQNFEASNRASVNDQTKAMIPFLIAMTSIFIPILKSVFKLKFLLVVWRFNKDIDRLLTTDAIVLEKGMHQLRKSLTDYYGNGEISEASYNALVERIEKNIPDGAPLFRKPIGEAGKYHRHKKTNQMEAKLHRQIRV